MRHVLIMLGLLAMSVALPACGGGSSTSTGSSSTSTTTTTGSGGTGGGSTTTTTTGSGGTGGGSTTTTTTGSGGTGGAIAVCGDGAVDGAESCDDGNTAKGDGCNDACQPEAGYTCAGAPSVCTTICGDGVIAGSELCDDGDPDKGDGCDDGCVVESGYSCIGVPSICASSCGDGIEAGAETCDDLNANPGDGCDAHCAVEVGYACAGTPSVCAPVCGDGILVGAETCDDMNASPNDGCNPSCTIQQGYTCMGAPSLCVTVCGDGILAGAETCDDMNANPNDGCSPSCTVQQGYACMGAPSACAPICGDGLLFGSEACDDGNLNNNDGCTSGCAIQLGYACNGAPSACVAVCGDGIKVGAETCDDHNVVGGDGCSAGCAQEMGYTCNGMPSVCATSCGDGVKAGIEACDDGNLVDNDCCSNTCRVICEIEPNGTPAQALTNGGYDAGLVIKGSISPAGDLDYYAINVTGKADLKIETFDGTGPNNCALIDTSLDFFAPNGTTNLGTDEDSGPGLCSRLEPSIAPGLSGLVPGVYYARVKAFAGVIATYTVRFTFLSLCGNGIIEGTEECDGNGPPCDANCQRIPVCGDGLLDGPEVCDDANALSGDGCSLSCAVEVGFLCNGTPSACFGICGDGMVVGAEQCDDSNGAIGDGCDNACHTETVLIEVEPNGTKAAADAAPILINGQSTAILGSIGVVGDKDVFKLSVAADSVFRIETFGASGDDCPLGLFTKLSFLNSAGVQLYTTQPSGILDCSVLVINVLAGTYYVQVEQRDNNATIPSYRLEVKVLKQIGAETEPNNLQGVATAFPGSDVAIFGGHQINIDSDFFMVTVPAGKSIRAETIEGNVDTCESGFNDSRLTLYNAAAVQLANQDSYGRGACASFDGTGSIPNDPGAHNLPAGNYYIQVRASVGAQSGFAGQFDYKLAMTIR